MSQNKQKEKEKGVEIRNVEDTERPRPTSTRSILTLKPLPKIDPKDKGKKMIGEEGESDTESDDITKAKKKFKMLAKDKEVSRKARINADKILAEELQKEEREKFTIKQRAKFLHDNIVAQRKFLAQQRSKAIRNKPPIRNQLRNQMMTYLKHVGGKKHSELKTKTFEEIQVLYETLKRKDQNFVAIGSAEDERQIKELNKDLENKRLKKRVVNETLTEEDTTKVSAEQEVTEQGTIDSEIMEIKSFIARLHKVSSPDGNYLVVYRVNGHFRAFNSLMKVLHNFYRHDLFHLYDLVMKQYSKITQEDIELIVWGDLKIMMESSTEENDQELKDGTVIYMLVERRYPLSKELLQQMIDLGLEGSQLTLLHSKELASPGLTVPGKDISNLLIADSLLKTIWLSIHLVVYNEELDILEQTATSKGISSLWIAKDVKIIKDQDQDLTECLDTSSKSSRLHPYCAGRIGISALVKCTSAIHQMAYDIVPDALNEYLQMGATTTRDNLVHFCNAVMELYGREYLRQPTYTDMEKIYAHHKQKHGFPGMIGSIDWTN
ncbi:hypothetical protein Tco_1093947 [Tanacetum coccineum]|uniref:Uncharacterized protein n=1 Tax=Tanacetum coccineum TaxID=301880 RepID=A0ABQ5IFH5_9ASTR